MCCGFCCDITACDVEALPPCLVDAVVDAAEIFAVDVDDGNIDEPLLIGSLQNSNYIEENC